MRRLILTGSLLLALSTTAMAGQVYKWVDAQGNTHFGSQPPEGQQATSINTNVATPKTPAPATAKPAAAVADTDEQKAIDSTVFGDQHGQRLFGRHVGAQLISKSFSKLEMARILRTSELACTTRTSDSSPPAWSRSNSSMPSAELSR